jgi:hypothetical protein
MLPFRDDLRTPGKEEGTTCRNASENRCGYSYYDQHGLESLICTIVAPIIEATICPSRKYTHLMESAKAK